MKKIAVLIPCYNEVMTIEKVVTDFKTQLPGADIFVYDNNSSDDTARIARESGAIIHQESRQGKGFVVEAMFRDIDADIYVMVDGDDTYPAIEVQKLIAEIEKGADLVVGDRLSNGTYAQENKRGLHGFGNWLVKFLINKLFKVDLHDIMSGYRAFSPAFVKNYPVLCDGFQVETDMTIFALDRNFVIKEVDINFQDRPDGSESKLNTYSDGFKVIMTIFNLYRHYKPLAFFGIISFLSFLLALAIGIPAIIEYIIFGYVYKVPSAILSATLMNMALLFFSSGLILDSTHLNAKMLGNLNSKKK